MLRQIVTPQQNIYPLHLPDDLVGKTIEVLAFELEEKELKERKSDPSKKRELNFYDSIHLDLSGYKFDRDEANER